MQADIISKCLFVSDELLLELISCRNLKRVMKRRTEEDIINAEMSAKKRERRIQKIIISGLFLLPTHTQPMVFSLEDEHKLAARECWLVLAAVSPEFT